MIGKCSFKTRNMCLTFNERITTCLEGALKKWGSFGSCFNKFSFSSGNVRDHFIFDAISSDSERVFLILSAPSRTEEFLFDESFTARCSYIQMKFLMPRVLPTETTHAILRLRLSRLIFGTVLLS